MYKLTLGRTIIDFQYSIKIMWEPKHIERYNNVLMLPGNFLIYGMLN